MKREYVKPVMESEAFVANEYVAACWTVTCGGECGQVIQCKHDNHDVGSEIITGSFGTWAEGCTNEISNQVIDIELWDENFWWLVGNVIFGQMSPLEAWDMYKNGKPIQVTTKVHPVSYTKGHTHDNWFFPKASC